MILFKIGFHTEEYIYILQNTPDSILKTYVMNDEKSNMSKTFNFSILIVSLFYQGFSNTKNTLKNWREKAREIFTPLHFSPEHTHTFSLNRNFHPLIHIHFYPLIHI